MSLFKKALPKKYIAEIRKRSDMQIMFEHVALVIAGNTAVVPDGKKEAEKFKIIAGLLADSNRDYIARVLVAEGFDAKQSYAVNDDGTVEVLQQPKADEPLKA